MYSISLFLHIVGALGMFIGLGLEQAGLFNLRRATSAAQAREWLSLVDAKRRIEGPSALVIVATGFYMVATSWRHQAWPGLSFLAMVLMAILGAAVTGRKLSAIRRDVSADRARDAAIRARLNDPALRLSSSLRLALAIGIVFNMSVKPGPWVALGSLLLALGLGALITVARPAATPKTTGYSAS